MTQARTKVAVIGAGYWGPNLIRNFSQAKGAHLQAICDNNPDNLKKVSGSYPGVALIKEYQEIIDKRMAEAVCIATPVETHERIAADFLSAGIHVFIEKPITKTAAAARRIADLAKAKGLTLMVGHVYLYHPAIREMRKIIEQGQLGEVRVARAVRTSLGPRVRTDVNIIWDYAIHECYILPYLFGDRVVGANAQGSAFLQAGIEDWVSATLRFKGGAYATVYVSWADPLKARTLTIVGSKRMLVYDELAEEKLRIYDRGYAPHQGVDKYGNVDLSLYDRGFTNIPLDPAEPLRAEVEHFIGCVQGKAQPISDGEHAYASIVLLERLQESVRQQGGFVSMP